MSSEKSCKTDEDMRSVLASLAYEETGMANEIYSLAERLNTALKPGRLDQQGIAAFIDSLKDLNSGIETVMSSTIRNESEMNDKIEKILKQ